MSAAITAAITMRRGADERGDADARVERVGRGIPQRLSERLLEAVRRGDRAGERLARRIGCGGREGLPAAARFAL